MEKPKSHSEIAEENKELIRELYCNEGKSLETIARQLSISRPAVTKKINEWGFVKRTHHDILYSTNVDMIRSLYCQQGLSKSETSRQLGLNRQLVAKIIDEYHLIKADIHYPSEANALFIKNHKDEIITMLNDAKSISETMAAFGKSADFFNTIRLYDKDIDLAGRQNVRNMHDAARKYKEQKNKRLHDKYDFDPIDGEEWKSIEGFDNYLVSSCGRAAHKMHNGVVRLLTPCPNKNNGRMYVSLVDNDGHSHNCILARVVAMAFCPGWSEEKDTVNHKDGNILNNTAQNLEWTSQSENNKHAYEELNRTKVNFRRYIFSEIIYKDEYHFTTVHALAAFLHKSETQTRRYFDNPEKHDLKLIQ